MNRSRAAGLDESALAASRSVGIGWLRNLAIELIAQHNYVLTIPREQLLVRVSRVPDPGLAHKIETSPANYGGPFALCVGAEEDGGPEYPLKGSNQASVLGTALLHGKRVEHLRGAFERDSWSLLTNRKGRQKNGDQSILPPGQTVARMPGDLKEQTGRSGARGASNPTRAS
jgi:hypothetical protein